MDKLPHIAIEMTPELEARLRELHKDASALNIACLPTLFVETTLADADGTVIENKKYKSNSFNRNFYNSLATILLGINSSSHSSSFGAGSLRTKDINGSLYYSDLTTDTIVKPRGAYQTRALSLYTSADDDSCGILVGSGSGAESFDGYAIGTKIAHGSGSGQLQYGATSVSSAGGSYESGSKTWSMTYQRSFTNASGASIDVNESCIQTYGSWGSSSRPLMYERTKYASAKSIGNGQVLTVAYTFSFTFPE